MAKLERLFLFEFLFSLLGIVYNFLELLERDITGALQGNIEHCSLTQDFYLEDSFCLYFK